jgi:hypothetical protein
MTAKCRRIVLGLDERKRNIRLEIEDMVGTLCLSASDQLAPHDFIQKMSGVRSPSAFVELSTEHARKQLESLTEQAKELATLAQKATLATAEPLKTASKPLVR